MKKIFFLFFSIVGFISLIAQKHAGINTSKPLAALHVADGSVLFTGPSVFQFNPTPPPVNGPGGRMMWYPAKGAFLAGAVDAGQWNQFNPGYTFFASGYNTKAFGGDAVAMRGSTTASGEQSTAMAYITTSSDNSIMSTLK
jgi:hypothetical protein